VLGQVAITTDAELVGLALTGDGDAFHQLFDRHRDRVTAVCRQRLRSSSDVDDAVQEAFARALANLRQLREAENFGPWIRSIAVRACMDHHRAAARLIPVDDEKHGEAEDNAPLPDEMLLAAERNASLRATFQELGERDRRALWMRHVSEAPVAAVAMELGLTEGSTRVLLTRARHRLRAATTSLPVFIPLSWRQWFRDHFPATAPALDALVVAVALTIAGTASAAAVIDRAARVETIKSSSVTATAKDHEPARPKGTGKAAKADGGSVARGNRRAVPPASPPDAGQTRRGALNRISNSVQFRNEYPDEGETDELVELTVLTDKGEADEDENALNLYARQVKPVVDAANSIAPAGETFEEGQNQAENAQK
jgi:RNA polymerase sigma-70 factor (ECF subfamily)